jgi:hypothetical protein
MLPLEKTSLIKDSLPTSQTVFIVLGKNHQFDCVAAGLALYLSLKKAGKQVTIASPQEITVEFSSLVGVNEIKNKLEGRDLNLYFEEAAVDKVSSNLDGHKLILVIRPKNSFTISPPEKLEYHDSGGEADLIFTLGVVKPEDLGNLYRENKALFDQESKIFRLEANEVASYSEQVIYLLEQLGLPVDVDIATNLISGLEKTTNFSSPNTTAETFEAMAFCLRHGGQRRLKKPRPLEVMPTEVSSARPPEEMPPADWFQPKIYKGNVRV